MNFAELVTNSVFARALALIILAMALIGAGVVAAADYLTGHNPPTEIINFLYVGLGAALAITGINFGVVLQPAPKPAAPAAPAKQAPAPAAGGASV